MSSSGAIDAEPTSAELDLLRAALLPDERAIEAWNRWRTVADRFDVARRLLPLAEWNLRRISQCGSLTGRDPDPLQAAWIRNQRTLDTVAPALAELKDRGVEVVTFKGFALASSVYPSLATRPIGDVDLLVRGDDLEPALETFLALGWRETGERAPSARPHLHGFELERDGEAVDLHVSALYECRAPDADRSFWQRRRRFRVSEQDLWTLAPCDHLLLLCVHGQRWSARPAVHWLADATLLIRRSSRELDWDALLAEAEARSLLLPLATALRRLRDEVDAEVPAEILERLAQAPRPAWQRLEAKWRGRGPSLVGGAFLHWCDWRRTNLDRSTLWRLVTFPWYLGALWGVEGLGRLPVVAAAKARARLVGGAGPS